MRRGSRGGGGGGGQEEEWGGGGTETEGRASLTKLRSEEEEVVSKKVADVCGLIHRSKGPKAVEFAGHAKKALPCNRDKGRTSVGRRDNGRLPVWLSIPNVTEKETSEFAGVVL